MIGPARRAAEKLFYPLPDEMRLIPLAARSELPVPPIEGCALTDTRVTSSREVRGLLRLIRSLEDVSPSDNGSRSRPPDSSSSKHAVEQHSEPSDSLMRPTRNCRAKCDPLHGHPEGVDIGFRCRGTEVLEIVGSRTLGTDREIAERVGSWTIGTHMEIAEGVGSGCDPSALKPSVLNHPGRPCFSQVAISLRSLLEAYSQMQRLTGQLAAGGLTSAKRGPRSEHPRVGGLF